MKRGETRTERLEREAQAQAQQDVNNEYTLYLIGGLAAAVGAASCLYLNKDKVTEMLLHLNANQR